MTNQGQTSSGSDNDARYAMIDEKKRKRMLSNRESARRSRLKRQKQMEDTINEIAYLQKKIQEGKQNYDLAMQRLAVIASENSLLMAEKMRLESYMGDLEIIIKNSRENSCFYDQLQVSEISDLCREPWLDAIGGPPSSSMHPIMSSGISGFRQFCT